MIVLPVSATMGLAMALLKIPLLLNTARLAALATTPPELPPTEEEKEKYDGKADPMKTVVRRTAPLYGLKRGLYWANALLESAVILSDSFALDAVLAYLVRDSMRRTHNIRFTATWLAGCALMHCGSLLRLASYRALGRFFTWELSIKKGHTLITHGPYAVVRHPAYTGAVCIAVGEVLYNFGPGSWYAECVGWDTRASTVFTTMWVGWTALVTCLIMRRGSVEDGVLKAEFGEDWEAYARKTPYRLFPYIY